jgi:hypothetical protein
MLALLDRAIAGNGMDAVAVRIQHAPCAPGIGRGAAGAVAAIVGDEIFP